MTNVEPVQYPQPVPVPNPPPVTPPPPAEAADHLAAVTPAIDARKAEALAAMAQAGTRGINAYLQAQGNVRNLDNERVDAYTASLAASQANFRADEERRRAALERYAAEAAMAEGALRARADAEAAALKGGGGGGGGGRRGGGGGGGGTGAPSGEVLARDRVTAREAERKAGRSKANKAGSEARRNVSDKARQAGEAADARARRARAEDSQENRRMTSRVEENSRRIGTKPSLTRTPSAQPRQAQTPQDRLRIAAQIAARRQEEMRMADQERLRFAQGAYENARRTGTAMPGTTSLSPEYIRQNNAQARLRDIASSAGRSEREAIRRNAALAQSLGNFEAVEMKRQERARRAAEASSAGQEAFFSQWAGEQQGAGAYMGAYNRMYSPEMQAADAEQAEYDRWLFSRESPEAIEAEVETVSSAELERLMIDEGMSYNEAWSEVYGANGYREDYYNSLKDILTGPTAVWDDIQNLNSAQAVAEITRDVAPQVLAQYGVEMTPEATRTMVEEAVAAGYGARLQEWMDTRNIDVVTGSSTPYEDPYAELRERAQSLPGRIGADIGIMPEVSEALVELPEVNTLIGLVRSASRAGGESDVQGELRKIEDELYSGEGQYGAFSQALDREFNITPDQFVRFIDEYAGTIGVQYSSNNYLGG